MEQIRKNHNFIKRRLIQNCTPQGSTVLDVGCGAGGDLKKWAHCCPKVLHMCDPNEDSLKEARDRAKSLHSAAEFFLGAIDKCPNRMYDVICYNFSLHYIFDSKKLFFDTLQSIRNRLAIGGRLIGIIPDSESILMDTPFCDEHGNFMRRKNDTGHGDFGEKVFVYLAETLFYSNGAESEPIAYRDMLVTHLFNIGIELEEWTRCQGASVTRMYSQFIFIRTH